MLNANNYSKITLTEGAVALQNIKVRNLAAAIWS